MGENVSFGEYLRALREEKKFTQTFIADATDISEKTLRRIELDKATPRIETLEKMSLIFKEDRECYKNSLKKAMSTAALIGLDELRLDLSEKCIEHFQYDASVEVDGFFQ